MSREFLAFFEKLLLKEMKKRMYWSDGEAPFVEWCSLLEKKSLRINLSKVIFGTEGKFKLHLDVLKKISDKETYYEAEDCERFLFDVYIPHDGVETIVKIYLSKVNFSMEHKKSDGYLFRLDAYAFIDIPDKVINEGVNSEKTLTTIKRLEENIWNTYRENKLAI